RWTMLLRGANINGEIIASEFAASGVLGVSVFCGHNTHQVSRGPLCTVNRAKKRILDLSLTVPILILLAPLLIIVALAIKVESTGPVLFQQNRMGRGNRVFKIMKFRSMRTDMSDSSGERSASRDDDRVTRVGRLIRATSIDELPQLINVLLGDMSLVGPRPHALGSRAGNQLFWEIDEKYWIRHCLKPGITGLAQVRGYRGATDVPDDLINRLGADLEYIDSWTLSREIVILLRTLKVIVHRNAF
ncbi:MAG: sugar transferase, partial [Sphingobium sp.]